MRRQLAAAGAAAILLACADRPAVPDATYRLVAHQGGPIPFLLQSNDNCYHMLKGGAVVLGSNSRYVSSFDIEKACPGQEFQARPMGARGEFRLIGDSLLFEDSAGTVIGRGSMAGDTLRVTGPLHTLIYLKQ